MKFYIHKTGTRMQGFSSHEEHCFYEDTTKRQMFLIIEQMAEMLKEKEQSWVEKAKQEVELLKINGIK
jgi:hypothetical protein